MDRANKIVDRANKIVNFDAKRFLCRTDIEEVGRTSVDQTITSALADFPVLSFAFVPLIKQIANQTLADKNSYIHTVCIGNLSP